MASLAATEIKPKEGRAARVGRPPRELAGEVDDRILDAARRAFLERGLAGASIDEIARLARAGKPTIYARFPTKEALFAAVAMRNSQNVKSGFTNRPPAGATMDERLSNLAVSILNGLLGGDAIDFMRLSIAEARRFPDLANVGRIIRDHAAQAITRVLTEAARTDEIGGTPAFAPERIEATAQFFMDLAIGRLLMRGLFGEDPDLLRAEIGPHVARSVPFFIAACRNGRT
jgi:AcrR family transcriptional regulator